MQDSQQPERQMDEDRVKGAADQAKGSFKSAAGKVLGDEKLKAEGAADKAKGKVESAIGGMKGCRPRRCEALSRENRWAGRRWAPGLRGLTVN
jgi:uncharacterized protein YjbJ (UPF0337 family)